MPGEVIRSSLQVETYWFESSLMHQTNMITKSYDLAVRHSATLAPNLTSIGGPAKFFAWAESVVDMLSFIYSVDSDEVMEYLLEEVKEYQEYDDIY